MLLYHSIWFQLKEAGKVIWGFGLLCGLDKWKLHWFYPINGFKPTVSCSTSYVLFCYLIALESPPLEKKLLSVISHFPFSISRDRPHLNTRSQNTHIHYFQFKLYQLQICRQLFAYFSPQIIHMQKRGPNKIN